MPDIEHNRQVQQIRQRLQSGQDYDESVDKFEDYVESPNKVERNNRHKKLPTTDLGKTHYVITKNSEESQDIVVDMPMQQGFNKHSPPVKMDKFLLNKQQVSFNQTQTLFNTGSRLVSKSEL